MVIKLNKLKVIFNWVNSVIFLVSAMIELNSWRLEGKRHTHILTDMQTFAVDLVGPACIVAEGFDAAVQVNEEGLQKGLSSVQSLQGLKK